MIVEPDSIRSFVAQYSSCCKAEIDLNKAVSAYKRKAVGLLRYPGQNEDFAIILNKVLGVILSQARKLNNPDFTESDAFSHGIEVLVESIEKWNPKLNSAFLTYFYVNVHNRFDTLAYRSKLYRSYIHADSVKVNNKKVFNTRKDIEMSLDALEDEFGDSVGYTPFKNNFFNKSHLQAIKLEDNNQRKILNTLLENSGITKKKQLMDTVEMSEKEFRSSLTRLNKILTENLNI